MGEDKRIILLFLLLFTAYTLCAESPELRKVMPNSWKKVSKLTAKEEAAFLQENSEALSNIKTIFAEKSNNLRIAPNPDYLFTYKQTVGDDIFFRVLLTDDKKPDFLSKDVRFIQCLIYNGRVVLGGYYGAVLRYEWFALREYSSLDIIDGKTSAKGVMLTQVSLSISLMESGDYKIGADSYHKGQLGGGVAGRYFFMDDIRNAEESDFDFNGPENYYGFGGDGSRMWVSGKRYCIKIEASSCLIDENIPLRYSLQNAFDNEPSTSFVENTDDDLLSIKFIQVPYGLTNHKIYTKIKKLAVINGYAQNMSLYKSNNRIKRFISFENDSILDDGMLSYQYITENVKLFFLVKEIYKGAKYNDTCIAELNFLTEDGWLFGDIDE